jgi:hypothetical protein
MLRKIDRFFRLQRAEKELLLWAYLLLWFLRIVLWLLPFKVIRAQIERGLIDRKISADKRHTVATIIWSIRAMSRYVPQATCLTQALAGKVLLAAFGYEACVRIGVGKDHDGKFQAHAWLEECDRIILGGSEEEYTPLLSWSKS